MNDLPALYDNCASCDVPFEIFATMPMRVRVGEPPGTGAFYQCPRCLLLRLHEDHCIPDEDYATDQYRADLNQAVTAEAYHEDHAGVTQQQAQCLNLRKDVNVVDVGCGAGLLLDALLENDPTLGTAAVEPSAEYRRIIDAQGRHTTFPSAADAQVLGPTANYVLLMLVLEHVSDPWQLLRDVKPLLAHAGEVCITVPSLVVDRAWTDAAYRRVWFCAQHRWYFSFSALGTMLNKCGYSVTSEPQYWTRNDGWAYAHMRGVVQQ